MAKQYITIHNMLQADSLVLASNLLVKRYEGTRITLTQNEYDDDDNLLYSAGEYEIRRNLAMWVSSPLNKEGETTALGAPYYDTTSDDYNGKFDSSNVSGGTRADGTAAVEPYYIDPTPKKYYFYEFQATKGGFVPECGETWKITSSSGIIDGNNASCVAELKWVAPENPNFDAISCPESATYDPTAATGYNGEHDYSNVSTREKKADGITPTAAPYWNGNDYTEFLEEQFDTDALTNLPVEDEISWKKTVIAHTNSALPVSVALRLEDNRVAYAAGDNIYLKASAAGVIPDNPKKGEDFADVQDTTFTDVKTLVTDDLAKLIHAPKVEPTEAKVVFDDNSLRVDSLVIDMAWMVR